MIDFTTASWTDWFTAYKEGKGPSHCDNRSYKVRDRRSRDFIEKVNSPEQR